MDLSIFKNFLNYGTLITVLSALFIFNFGSLFTLAQENHQKFHSLKLLKMVLSPFVISLVIIIPVILIIFTVIDIIPEKYAKLYSVISIIYGIGSSCFLLSRLKRLLDPIYIARKLISEQRKNEIYYYKTSQVEVGESIFDDLLELICGTIGRNADIESRKLFDYIFEYFSINIDEIKPSSKIIWERRNNRFNIFFNTIVEKIIEQDNAIIKSHYVESIYNIFFTNIDISDFYRIDFPISSLIKLASRSIERGANQDNKVATGIFYTIINPMDNILSKLEESKNKANFFIQESEQFVNFKEVVLDKILELYETANKEQNSDFIKHTTMVRRFFNTYSGNDFIKWNNNYLKCYQEISYTYRKILEKNNYDKNSVEFVISEYRNFAYNISLQNIDRTLIKHLFNSFMHDTFYIYDKLIDNIDFLKSHDYEIFYERIRDISKTDDYQISNYLTLFYKLTKKYFSKNKTKENFDIYNFNDLWMRIEQIGEIWKEKKITKFYCSEWFKNVELLKKEFPELYTSYLEYIDAYKKDIDNMKKAMKEEVFVE